MILTEYLTANNLRPSKFAMTMGVPPSTIMRLLKGERSPSLVLLDKIMRATGGAVTPNDFLPAREPQEAAE